MKSHVRIATGAAAKERKEFSMDKSAESECFHRDANERADAPSFTSWRVRPTPKEGLAARLGAAFQLLIMAASLASFGVGCGEDTPPAKAPAETKAPELSVPEEVQSAADALLGKETRVLLVGDLAKNGHQEFLAANVVPKTPKNNNIPGTIVTRAVVAQNDDGKWMEVFRCDEYLKNAKGYLPGTPLSGITGWRLAYDQDPDKGVALYFTPLQGTAETHQLPIGIRWNPETKRYQSLDRSYEHFLMEVPSLQHARSNLR